MVYKSTTSGLLTVWLQAMWPLYPRLGNGDPKKHAPRRFQPSSLTTCPSYHWPGPKKGWCGLMNMRAFPEADFPGLTAHMLDPTCSDIPCRLSSAAASSARNPSGNPTAPNLLP